MGGRKTETAAVVVGAVVAVAIAIAAVEQGKQINLRRALVEWSRFHESWSV